MDAPVAKQISHVWERPTGPVSDPWAWLADRNDADTRAYLDAENAHADAWFAERADLVESLFEELRSRVQETDTSVPVRKGAWWYVSRTQEGQQYPIHCRGPARQSATDVVILDENLEAAGEEHFSLGAFDVSPDGSLLAWSFDADGGERCTMRIRRLDDGTDLDDELTDTAAAGTAWSADSRWLFYVRPDDAMRPFQVWRHRVGTSQAGDVLVVEEPDERFYVAVELTRSERWIVIASESKASSEAMLIPSDDPLAAPRSVRTRAPGVEYGVDDWGDQLVVLTNLDAEDFRVMVAPHASPDRWTELVAHVAGRRITAAEPYSTHLVLHEWCDAQQRLRILFRDGTERVVDLGDEPHEVELDGDPEWASTTVRFSYQSLSTPVTVYEEDVQTGRRELLKQVPVPGVDLDRYVAHRLWATAPDGERVPFDVVHAVGTAPDGTAPCLVYGYGSYEISIPPWFSVGRLSLLDRGWTWVLVHPRGGGELGRRWYLDGKLLAKQNTFTDTLACVEHLLAEGWAAPGAVAIRGGSAGGLLVGACVTQRPDLFGAAVAEVPFVDVVTTMSDPSLPLTVTEWEEWGDPRSEPWASCIGAYSPYDNVRDEAYPPMYVTAGWNDPRVTYHEPAKWVAKLRACARTRGPLLLRTEMGAGHGGASGRYERWRDEARVGAFLLRVLGDAPGAAVTGSGRDHDEQRGD